MSEERATHRRLAFGLALLFSLEAALVSGRLHPDEVYQFLEPSLRRAFGFGFVAWEWEEGLRNWFAPGLFSLALRAVDALGATSVMARRLAVAVPVALLIWPGLRTAVRRTVEAIPGWGGWAALALFLTVATNVVSFGRTLGEPLGGLLVLGALGLLEARRDAPTVANRTFGAGLLFGAAVGVRYPFAAMAVAAVFESLVRRRFREAGWLVAGGLVAALALGGLDWATWGAPFHSMRKYLEFNLGSGAARKFGSEPWDYFGHVLRDLAPWALLVGVRQVAWRHDRLLLPALVHLLAISATPHKEERFAWPALLLLALSLAPAAVLELQGWLRRGLLGAMATAAVLGLHLFTWQRAWKALPDLEIDLFHATRIVGADPALDRLLIVNESRWGCGGEFFVGRQMDVLYTGPGYPGFFEAMRDPHVNRVVVFRGVEQPALVQAITPFGFHEVSVVGGRTPVLAR